MTPRCQIARLVPALALLLMPALPAPGQAVQLPCAVASQQSIGTQEKGLIASYAEQGLALLASDDPEDVERGRERLATPLRCPEVSAAFRIEYWRAVEAGLKRAVGSDDTFVAANALLVTGLVSTNSALQTIENAMQSPREPVRAAAAVAFQHTLREQATGRARLTTTVVESALTSAGTRLAAETSPTVVESLIVALRAGADRESPVAPVALRAMGRGVAGAFAKAREAESVSTEDWAHAAHRATETIWRATFDAQVGAVDQEQALASAEACAQIVAYARDRAADEENPMSDSERDLLAKAIDSAEGALILIHSRVTNDGSVPKSLAAAFGADPESFGREADKWVGSSGRLTKAPYRFDAADFAAP